MRLLALQYNNYFNRIVKQETDWNNYEDGYRGHSFVNMNFNPNDGVSTSIVVNWTFDFTPDYLVVADDDYNIVSRWFIIEAVRLKGGQYQLTLRRDLIVDNYDKVLDAPMFIERGYLNPSSPEDPAIFNKEGLGFNQIKKKETMIKGNIEGPWLVMYLKDKPEGIDKIVNFSSSEVVYDYSFTTLPPDSFVVINNKEIVTYERYNDNASFGTMKWQYTEQVHNNCMTANAAYKDNYKPTGGAYHCMTKNINDSILEQYGREAQYWVEDFNNAIGYTEDIDYRYLDGKTIYVNGALYKCSVSMGNRYRTTLFSRNGAIYQDIKTFFNSKDLLTDESEPFYVNLINEGYTYNITYDNITETSTYHTTVTPSASSKVNNQPYFMICAPLTDKVTIAKADEIPVYNGNSNIALGLYKELSKTSEWLVDAQVLPYCPIEKFKDMNLPFESELLLPADYPCLDIHTGERQHDDDPETEIVMRVPFVLEDSFTIEKRLTIDVDNYKVSNECDMYRLVSPNYNGAFEFSAAKNYGIDKFIIRCTYKPISPLINVTPAFKGLYGNDYKDNRGLICQGSFQLGRETDEFKEYEYRNKNYQNAFNTQIAALDKQNQYQLAQDITNAAVGAAGAGLIGSKMGVAGGIAGVGAAGAGIADVAINKQLRDLNKEVTIKQHQYQLGNIQALSYTVSNISNIDILSKVYPFLEYYTCTDIEKQSLIDFLEFKGYTIGRIGRISEFLKPERHYLQGYLLRLDDLGVETHETLELNNELSNGVYI